MVSAHSACCISYSTHRSESTIFQKCSRPPLAFSTLPRSLLNSRRGVPPYLSLAECYATRLWRIIDGWRVSDRLARQRGVHVGPPLGARPPQSYAPSTSLCALEGQNILFVFVTSSSSSWTTDCWRSTTPSPPVRDLARPNYTPNGGDGGAIRSFVFKAAKLHDVKISPP